MFLFHNLFGKRLAVFSVYEFGTLVFFSNGYYNDKHKWLSLMEEQQQGWFAASCVLSRPLVCAWVTREESGACCISIRASKTVGTFTATPFDLGGEKTEFLFLHVKRNESQQLLE